jgi:hypothetical protein
VGSAIGGDTALESTWTRAADIRFTAVDYTNTTAGRAEDCVSTKQEGRTGTANVPPLSNPGAKQISYAPTGGDPLDCFIDREIDEIVATMTLMPAAAFWKFKRGEITPQQMQEELARNGATILHTRNHWLVIELRDAQTGLGREMRVYDSAPSEPVKRDVRRIAAQLQLPTPTFIRCPRQARGTNECGLFAMANVISSLLSVFLKRRDEEISMNH